jgi:hypothetical protein
MKFRETHFKTTPEQPHIGYHSVHLDSTPEVATWTRILWFWKATPETDAMETVVSSSENGSGERHIPLRVFISNTAEHSDIRRLHRGLETTPEQRLIGSSSMHSKCTPEQQNISLFTIHLESTPAPANMNSISARFEIHSTT